LSCRRRFGERRGGLVDTLRQGRQAFHSLYDATIFQYLAEHGDLATVFNRFMTAQSNLHNAAIVDAYDFTGVRTVVDVGGGHGATLAAIVTRYPGTNGVLFDLPEVVAGASIEDIGLGGRCEVAGGDMLASVPGGGDAYIIKRVMMDKTDDDAVAVLRNCLAAMNRDGRVLVIDPMLPEPNQPHPNWFTDMLMMVVTNGRCRTRDQFRKIFDTAGLALNRIVATNSPNFIVEGTRN
jgi:O-methyltransferase domain